MGDESNKKVIVAVIVGLVFIGFIIYLINAGNSTNNVQYAPPAAEEAPPAEVVVAEEVSSPETVDSEEKAVEEQELNVPNEVQNLFDGFIQAINSKNTSDIIDCLAPEVSEKYFDGIRLLNFDSEAFKVLYPYIGTTVGFSYDMKPDDFSNIRGKIIECSVKDNLASIKYTIDTSLSDGTSNAKTIETTFVNENGNWYLPASKKDSVGGEEQPPEITVYDGYEQKDILEHKHYVYDGDEGFSGWVDDSGNPVISPSFDKWNAKPYDDYLPVCFNNFGWGFIDKNMNLAVYYGFDSTGEAMGNAHDGFYPVKIDKEWCFYNPSTSQFYSTGCEYLDTDYYYDGYYHIRTKERNDSPNGLFNPTTNKSIPCEYEDIGRFDNGLIPVKKDGYWGVIDENNNVIVDFAYDEVGKRFHNHKLGVAVNKCWGVIDEEGNYLLELDKGRKLVEIYDDGMIICGDDTYDPDYTLYDENLNELYSDVLNRYWVSSDRCIIKCPIVEGDYPNLSKSYNRYKLIDGSGKLVYDISDLSNIIIDYADLPADKTVGLSYNVENFNFSDYDCFVITCYPGSSDLYYILMDYDGNIITIAYTVDYSAAFKVLDDDCYMTKGNGVTRIYGRDNKLIAKLDNTGSSFHLGDYTIIGHDIIHKDGSIETYDSIKAGDSTEKNPKALIVSDGIFYGLFSSNGFEAEGIVYNNIKYDSKTKIYTLERGAKSLRCRISTDGTFVNLDEYNDLKKRDDPLENESESGFGAKVIETKDTSETNLSESGSSDAMSSQVTEKVSKDYIIPKKFSLEGKWKNVGGGVYGMMQKGSIVTFNGAYCNAISPSDSYAYYKDDDGYRLDVTDLMGQNFTFRIMIVDDNNIDLVRGDYIVELTRVN